MNRTSICRWLPGIMLGLFVAVAGVGLFAVERRAKAPKFSARDVTDTFFGDVFSEALKGSRPANLGSSGPPMVAGNPTVGGEPGGNAGSGDVAGWQEIISPTTIEDELKRIKLDIDKEVTTPSKFAGRGYLRARKLFSIAALMFGVINEHDGNVRWKEDAAAARDVFARTAGNAKVGTIQVFNEAKLRQQELADLVNGSKLTIEANEPENDWSKIVDRSPLMQRLESGFQGKIQPMTANKASFSDNSEDLYHEAQIVAAIAEVLIKDGMPDGGDDDYKEFCETMKKSAVEIVDAIKLNNYDAARTAAGNISQACTQCHEYYRG
jgi:hypothetical protein